MLYVLNGNILHFTTKRHETRSYKVFLHQRTILKKKIISRHTFILKTFVFIHANVGIVIIIIKSAYQQIIVEPGTNKQNPVDIGPSYSILEKCAVTVLYNTDNSEMFFENVFFTYSR